MLYKTAYILIKIFFTVSCSRFQKKKFLASEKGNCSEKDKIELETMFSIASDPLLGFETEYKRREYF